jgi:hypothetical protein
MKRVCIIGDSHIGALQSGWRALGDEFPDIEVTSFGAPRPLFDELQVSGRRLVPASERLREYFVRTSGGEAEISGAYDRYLVCGLSWAMRLLLPSIGKFRSEDLVVDGRVPLSNDCYDRVMKGLLRDSLTMRTLKNLRTITDRPIAVIPAPMPSDMIPAPVYRRFCDSGDAQPIAACFLSAAAAVAKDVDVELIRQPPETLSNPIQTLQIYKRGSVRTFQGNLDIEHGEDDHQHMNAAYGALVLRAALSADAQRMGGLLRRHKRG